MTTNNSNKTMKIRTGPIVASTIPAPRVIEAGASVAVKSPAENLYLGIPGRVERMHPMTDGSQCAVVSFPVMVRDEKVQRSMWHPIDKPIVDVETLQIESTVGTRHQFFVRAENLRLL